MCHSQAPARAFMQSHLDAPGFDDKPNSGFGRTTVDGADLYTFFLAPPKRLAGSLVGGFGASIARSRVELSYATLVSPLFSAGH